MGIFNFHNTPAPAKRGEGIVCAISDNGIRDERTGVDKPLVYQLSCQGNRWVAMFGKDKY